MDNYELVLALTPVVVGLVQLCKAVRLPSALAPAVTVLAGVGAAGLWVPGPWRDVTLTGVIIGLNAAGLYSGVQATQGAVRDRTTARRLAVRSRST